MKSNKRMLDCEVWMKGGTNTEHNVGESRGGEQSQARKKTFTALKICKIADIM